MSEFDDLSGLPSRVLRQLGPAPDDLSRLGSSRVLRGNGAVLKAGPADRAAREAFVLAQASRLPLPVPTLLEAGEGWILLEEVAEVSGSRRDGTLADLARLHETLADDEMLNDSRLRDVTGAELPGLHARSVRLAEELELPDPLRTLAAGPAALLANLGGPMTLVHGDAWPGNVIESPDGRRCWIDWEEAGVGHAALDLANWCFGSPWVPPSSDPDRDLATYLAARTVSLDAQEFRLAVDSAVVLLFLLLDLPGLADAGVESARALVDVRAKTARRLVQLLG